MPSPALRITIGGYEVVRGLEASDRELYLATKPGVSGEYVLALFEVPEAHAKQLELEVERCKALKSRAIMSIVEVFQHDKKRVVVFESVPGISLSRMVKQLEEQHEQLGDGAIMHIGRELMDALSEAHTARDANGKIAPIVHGELGPHQIFLSWEGEVKILGFGLTPMFLLSSLAKANPKWTKGYTAPEVRAGGMLTPRANAYSAGALLWTLFSREKLPEDDLQPKKLRQLRPDLSPMVAAAIDRALDPSIRRRNTCQAVARALARSVKPEDAQDLRWSMEVLRAVSTIDEQALPSDAFPPSVFPPSVTSMAPISSIPPDGDDEPTTPFFEVPAELSHIKLPDSVLPPDEDVELPEPPSDDFEPGEQAPTVLMDPESDPLPTPRLATRPKRRGTLKGLAEVKVDDAAGASHDDEEDDERASGRSLRRTGKRRRSESRQRPGAKRSEADSDPLELDADEQDDEATQDKPDGRRRHHNTTPGVGLAKSRLAARSGAKAIGKVGTSTMASQALRSGASKPPAVPRRTSEERAEAKAAAKPKPTVPKSVPPIRSDFDSSLFDEITTEKDREEGLPAIERAIQQAAEELKTQTLPAPSDPQEVAPPKPASDAVRLDPLPPPPVFQQGQAAHGMEQAPSSQGPPSSHYPMAYLSPSQPPPSQGPMSGSWMGNPVTVAPPGSIIVPPGGQLPSAGMLPLKWVVIVAMTAVASFALGLLVASGGVEVRLAQSEPAATETATAAPAPPPPAPPPAPEVKPEPAPKPSPEPKAEDEPASSKSQDNDPINEDASNLPVTQGYLIVTSPAEDGYVYVRGQRVGVVGKPLQVPCGLHFVRVGNQNVTRWHTHGRAVAVACQGVTKVNLPLALGPDPAQRGNGGQFINGGSKSGGVWTPGDL